MKTTMRSMQYSVSLLATCALSVPALASSVPFGAASAYNVVALGGSSAALTGNVSTSSDIGGRVAAAGAVTLGTTIGSEVLLGDPLWATTGPAAASGSLTGYATAVAAAIRVSFGPSLLAGLDDDRRPAVESEVFGRRYPQAIADRGGSLFAWRLAILAVTSPSDS